MPRIPISKSKRFEVFARDGFTCQYCGLRPPLVALELDHIEAVAHGGSNDDVNLITSCSECNRGKSAKKLGEFRPRPDADLEHLKLEQEKAEVARYLNTKAERDKCFGQLVQTLSDVWSNNLTDDYVPFDRQWRVWLQRYSPDSIERAIHKAVPIYQRGEMGRGARACTSLVRYVSGILKYDALRTLQESKDSAEDPVDFALNKIKTALTEANLDFASRYRLVEWIFIEQGLGSLFFNLPQDLPSNIAEGLRTLCKSVDAHFEYCAAMQCHPEDWHSFQMFCGASREFRKHATWPPAVFRLAQELSPDKFAEFVSDTGDPNAGN